MKCDQSPAHPALTSEVMVRLESIRPSIAQQLLLSSRTKICIYWHPDANEVIRKISDPVRAYGRSLCAAQIYTSIAQLSELGPARRLRWLPVSGTFCSL
jgi:hypothetical protein